MMLYIYHLVHTQHPSRGVPSPAPESGDPVLAPREPRVEPLGNTSPTAAEASG